MDIREELRDQGWHITPDGYKIISQNATVNNKKYLMENALNTDIKEFGEPVLNNELKQNQTKKIVLQIQKIKNASAPKINEDSQVAPRMLKVALTDGHTICQGVEVSNINSLKRSHTAPGTKILINAAKVSSNCILLQPNCCTLLGGKVPALYEKWEVAKNISELRNGAIDGAPPWVNFGEKIVTAVSNEPFKSLTSKEAKQDEFDIQRQDAISVLATGAVKKVFGGGTKTVALSENVRKNFDRSKRRHVEKVEEQQKPTDKISLFNFLEDKLQSGQNTVKDHIVEKDYNVEQKQKFKPKPKNDSFDTMNQFTQNFEKISIGAQNNANVWNWKIGDLCMAKYWEDGKYYNATVVNLSDRTCVVKFSGYGNVEEVLKADCLPVTADKPKQYTTRNYRGLYHYCKD
ncbi:hypothetical protein FQA39_LY10335 [Lamprigera yunnana]|nr:hypothetical protein FQA39_LY10335 [Lamprigera yunnana]